MSDTTPPPPPPVSPYQPPQMSPSDEKLWATLIHLGWIAGSLVGLPFLPALIGYLVLKDRGPFVREHTAAALNFQLTMLIGVIAGAILAIVIIGIFVLLAVLIVTIVFSIMAAIAANNGQSYKYPIAITFVR